jgi:hypothetical protein
LGTDGLVVSIVLPISEVMLEMIWLFVLVAGLFVIVFRELSIGRITVLLDVSLVPIELPMRDVMFGLIPSFELFLSKVEELSTGRLTVLRLLMLLRPDEFDVDEFDRIVICRLNVLEFGAVERELIDRLDMLLLGVRLVIALLDVLVLGVRLVMALLDTLLLDVRLVMALLDMLLLVVLLVIALLETLLLGVRLVVTWLELRLDDTLLELLEEFDLGVDLDEEAELEDCRLC